MSMTRDHADAALHTTREAFTRMYGPVSFLVGGAHLRRLARPLGEPGVPTFETGTVDADGALAGQRGDTPVLLPIVKTQATFPSMITVGRTENNDIVLGDATISRFHAFFRVTEGNSLELGDAGSRNGTWLAGLRLPPKGAVQSVKPGDAVRFGNVVLTVLDAASAWDELHGLR